MMCYSANVIFYYLIGVIFSGSIYYALVQLFNICYDICRFYYCFNNENFIRSKQILNKPKDVSYLLELKNSRYFNKVLIGFKRDNKWIKAKWYDIDSIKYDAKGEFQLNEDDNVSLYTKYILKLEIKIFNYKLFEIKKESNFTEQLVLNNISKLDYKIVFKE